MKAHLAHNLRDGRFQALAGAAFLAALTFVLPALPLTRTGVSVLAVVDITGSMNVRDYTGADGKPVSRIDTARAALRDDAVDDRAEQDRRHHHPHRFHERDTERREADAERRPDMPDQRPGQDADDHLHVKLTGDPLHPHPQCAKRIVCTDHCI